MLFNQKNIKQLLIFKMNQVDITIMYHVNEIYHMRVLLELYFSTQILEMKKAAKCFKHMLSNSLLLNFILIRV